MRIVKELAGCSRRLCSASSSRDSLLDVATNSALAPVAIFSSLRILSLPRSELPHSLGNKGFDSNWVDRFEG